VWSPLTRSHGGSSKGVTDAAEHAKGSGGHMSQASEYPRAKGVVGEHLMGDPEDLAWPTEEDGRWLAAVSAAVPERALVLEAWCSSLIPPKSRA